MPNLNKADLIRYMAGFWEGEGTVSILRSKRNSQLGLVVTLTNTKLPALQAAQQLWGGSIREKPVIGNRKLGYTWQTNGVNAGHFLRDIFPCLLFRHAQAHVGIAFAKTVQPRIGNTRKQGIPREAPLLTFEEVVLRHDLYRQLQKLNRRGQVDVAEVILA